MCGGGKGVGPLRLKLWCFSFTRVFMAGAGFAYTRCYYSTYYTLARAVSVVRRRSMQVHAGRPPPTVGRWRLGSLGPPPGWTCSGRCDIWLCRRRSRRCDGSKLPPRRRRRKEDEIGVSAVEAGADVCLCCPAHRMPSPGIPSKQRQHAAEACGWPSESPVIKWAGRGNFEVSVWACGRWQQGSRIETGQLWGRCMLMDGRPRLLFTGAESAWMGIGQWAVGSGSGFVTLADSIPGEGRCGHRRQQSHQNVCRKAVKSDLSKSPQNDKTKKRRRRPGPELEESRIRSVPSVPKPAGRWMDAGVGHGKR